MDPIYESYRVNSYYWKVSLEVLEGPMKGNKQKWTTFTDPKEI